MTFQNSPRQPAYTKFVIRKSKDYLEIHPPTAKNFTLKEKFANGFFTLKIRLLIALLLVVLMSLILWISYVLIGFNPLFIFSVAVLICMLPWIFTFSTIKYLYFNAREDRFEIRLRSIEAKSRHEKLQSWGKISDIQYVVVSEQYQGGYFISRSLLIQTQRPYIVDWKWTKAESNWIAHEIQDWLSLQPRDSASSE